MARGQQKIQSQQKNAQKKAEQKKKTTGDSKKMASAALTIQCCVCKSSMGDLKTYKEHFESKHPKNALPPELRDQEDEVN